MNNETQKPEMNDEELVQVSGGEFIVQMIMKKRKLMKRHTNTHQKRIEFIPPIKCRA